MPRLPWSGSWLRSTGGDGRGVEICIVDLSAASEARLPGPSALKSEGPAVFQKEVRCRAGEELDLRSRSRPEAQVLGDGQWWQGREPRSQGAELEKRVRGLLTGVSGV